MAIKPKINVVLLLLTIVSFFNLISCSRSFNRKLIDVENVIDEYPDSALSMLEEIDPSSFPREQDKALYNLLITQAKEKCSISVKTDSVVSFAVSYFQQKNDKERAMKALNYQGNIRREYLKDNDRAIISYIQAYDLAVELDDKFWIGMTARGIADVYGDSYKGKDAVKYSTIAYENMKQTGRQVYIDYALLDLAKAYHTAREYEKAVSIATEVMDSAHIHKDDYLGYAALSSRALTFFAWNKLEESIKDYEVVCKSSFANKTDSTHLALSCSEIGLRERVYEITSKCDVDSFFSHGIQYRLARSVQDYKKALDHLEELDNMDYIMLNNKIDNSVASSIMTYYDFKNQNNALLLKIGRERFWFTLTIGLCIIIVLSFLIKSLFAKLKRNSSEKLLLAEQLESLLKENDHNKTVMESLLSSRYSMLENLCEMVVTSPDTKSAQKKIVNTVTDIIENLSIPGDKIMELEKEMDGIHGNVCSNFKTDFPNLKDADYRLFLFSVMGLSMTTIMLLQKETKIEAVYSRKKRLKAKVKAFDSPNADAYLKFL